MSWADVKKKIFDDAKMRELNSLDKINLQRQIKLSKIREREEKRIKKELKDSKQYSYDADKDQCCAYFNCSDLRAYENSWNPWAKAPCKIYKQIAREHGYTIVKEDYEGLIVGIDNPEKLLFSTAS